MTRATKDEMLARYNMVKAVFDEAKALDRPFPSNAAIQARTGLTRMVVVGIVYRMQKKGLLPVRVPYKTKVFRGEKYRTRRAKKVPPKPQVVVPQKPTATRGLENNAPFRTCQWPFGHVGEPDFHFCGKPPLSGKSYCQNHNDKSVVKGSRQIDLRAA